METGNYSPSISGHYSGVTIMNMSEPGFLAHSPCTVPYNTSSLCQYSYTINVAATVNVQDKYPFPGPSPNPSPNHLATRHCWRWWCSALPLTHQPTLQYNNTWRKGHKLHDVKMTYSKERYMKNNLTSCFLVTWRYKCNTMLPTQNWDSLHNLIGWHGWCS